MSSKSFNSFLPFWLALFLCQGTEASLQETKITLAQHSSHDIPGLVLSHYWVRPGNKGKNTAAYMTINNSSLLKDKLLKVECLESTSTELHDHINEEGIMKMRPVQAIIVETPTVDLKPGSLHIMLIGLKKDLKPGEIVKMHLIFEQSGRVDLSFPVQLRPTPAL